jgi:glycosyltransferase involved in cell wall biosynthesis
MGDYPSGELQTNRSSGNLPPSSPPLLVNLAMVGAKRTGIANYAVNLVSHLPLSGTLLLPPQKDGFSGTEILPAVPIPDNMSPDSGKFGHLRRLTWTQFCLPPLYQQHQSRLLFSPVPEAPLFSQCRSVVMVHDLIPLRFPDWRSPLLPYFRYYVPQVLAQAQHILCNSEATATEVHQTYGIPHHRLTAIPLAYDDTHFYPRNLPTQNYFLYLGRHDPHKNVSRIISAFAQLPQRQNYELWLVGGTDGRYTPTLQAQAAELGVAPQVKFLDYVAYRELPEVIGRAIALVFPSIWEGFGLPVLEAMACGTPVITSNLSALPEVAGEAALLVDPLEVKEIAVAMEQLVRDEAARSDLRESGLKQATHFSWKLTAQQTASVLQQLMV